jgi:hypothetical protein
MLVTVRNVTDRKRAEEALRDADRRIGLPGLDGYEVAAQRRAGAR